MEATPTKEIRSTLHSLTGWASAILTAIRTPGQTTVLNSPLTVSISGTPTVSLSGAPPVMIVGGARPYNEVAAGDASHLVRG